MTGEAGARWTAAGVLLVVKGSAAGLVALALIRATRRHPQRAFGQVIREPHVALGWFALALVLVTIVVGVAVLAKQPWSRLGAFVVEAVAIVAALTRLSSRPGLAIISIGVSVVIIALLAPAAVQATETPGGGS